MAFSKGGGGNGNGGHFEALRLSEHYIRKLDELSARRMAEAEQQQQQQADNKRLEDEWRVARQFRRALEEYAADDGDAESERKRASPEEANGTQKRVSHRGTAKTNVTF